MKELKPTTRIQYYGKSFCGKECTFEQNDDLFIKRTDNHKMFFCKCLPTEIKNKNKIKQNIIRAFNRCALN